MALAILVFMVMVDLRGMRDLQDGALVEPTAVKE